jgi:cytosine/adenosine deaminase-related metal-dependent hydrolase
MVSMGLRAHIGAHGENPLGLIYHAEMGFTKAGGLSNYETLRAATAHAAQTLGMWNSIGSVAEGKLGDLVILERGVDLLSDEDEDGGQGKVDVEEGLRFSEKTRRIRWVVRGGRVWDALSMDEVWPVKRKRTMGPRLNAD